MHVTDRGDDNMALWYYITLFILSFIMTNIYAAKWHKHFDVYFTLVFTMIPLVNLGYMMLALSKGLESALFAMRIIYIGGCFLIFFIMLSIFSLCGITVPKTVKVCTLIFLSILYLSVLTIGFLPWFYTNVSFEIVNGYGILHREYGPAHTVFYVMVVICFLVSFGAIIHSYFKKRQVSRVQLILLFIPELTSFFSYVGRGQLPYAVELLPASYTFAQFMYLLIANRITLYDVDDTVIDSMIHDGSVGFISLDFNERYLGASEAAKKVFPELLNLTVDYSIWQEPVIREVFLNHLNEFRESEDKNLFYYQRDPDSSIYEVTIQYLYDRDRKKGYQFVIVDDTENQKYIALINSYNSDLEKEVTKKTENLVQMHNKLIMGMAVMVESRDNSTGGHIRRTSEGVRILIDEMKKTKSMDETFCADLIKAAPMHDLGKIAVDDAVLRKPGKFTPEEFEKMKAHAAEGARIVNEILKDTEAESFRKLAVNVAHYHHERWDGSGYPERLKGEEIPLEARIMAIADVYDALVSKRVYKDAMSFEKADSIIMEGFGSQFDPGLKTCYENARPLLEEYYSSLDETGAKTDN